MSIELKFTPNTKSTQHDNVLALYQWKDAHDFFHAIETQLFQVPPMTGMTVAATRIIGRCTAP
jgi:hypothetical protein